MSAARTARSRLRQVQQRRDGGACGRVPMVRVLDVQQRDPAERRAGLAAGPAAGVDLAQAARALPGASEAAGDERLRH